MSMCSVQEMLGSSRALVLGAARCLSDDPPTPTRSTTDRPGAQLRIDLGLSGNPPYFLLQLDCLHSFTRFLVIVIRTLLGPRSAPMFLDTEKI